MLDLLEPDIGGQVQAATLQTIVCALVDEWDSIRVFPHLPHLPTIDIRGSIGIRIHHRLVQKERHHSCRPVPFSISQQTSNASVKILEFLYFYLIPEPALPISSLQCPPSSNSSSSESSGSDSSSSSTGRPPKILRRTTEEKKGIVGKLLGDEKGVEGLVRDLQEFRPFGDIG